MPCHSHNDYTRDVPLYDALSAGCMSVEADVWLYSGNLRVAHTDPGNSGPTIQDLYINPLIALLDAHNPKGGSSNGVYPQNSSQSFVLLIDFKSDGTTTWNAVYSALQPLRDAGYLSYWDASGFMSRPITFVASGNAPLAQAKVPQPILTMTCLWIVALMNHWMDMIPPIHTTQVLTSRVPSLAPDQPLCRLPTRKP